MNRSRAVTALTLLLAALGGGRAVSSAAQTAPPSDGVNQPADDGAQLQEVVVTAERRVTTEQKSAVPIEVLRGDALNTVTNAQDLNGLVAGMQVGINGPNPQVYIRGIGDDTENSRGQNAVPFVVDGVDLPRASAVTPMFFDIDRIEVLKGPQGTLYGRNSSGGDINVITNKPKLQDSSVDGGATFGNFNTYKIDGAVNIPVGDTLAFRVAAQSVNHSGYLSDGTDDQHMSAGRIRALWQPNDRISVLLNTDFARIDDKSDGQAALPTPNGNPWYSNVQQPEAFFVIPPGPQPPLPYLPSSEVSLNASIWGISTEFNADLGFATLTVLPGYRVQQQGAVEYPLFFRYGEHLDDHQTSVEVRLGHETERLLWVAGVYYYHDVKTDESDANFGSSAGAEENHDTDNARSVFGQGTLTIVDGLRVIGGIRYTREGIGGGFFVGNGAYPVIPFTPDTFVPAPPNYVDKTNYKGGFEYDLARESMLYGTVSTGFKTGGYSNTTDCGAIPFKPEDLRAWELGSKNRFFNDTLQVNLEAFYWQYSNQQIGVVTTSPCGSTALLTYNAASANIKGGDLDVTWRPTRLDSVKIVAEYANGDYDKFTFTQAGAFPYGPGSGSPCPATPAAGAGVFNVDCSGQDLIRLPRWSATVRLQHDIPLGVGGTLAPKFDLQGATQRWLDIGYNPNGRAPGYVLGNFELAYTPVDAHYTVSAYCDNVSNKAVYTEGNFVGTGQLAPNGYAFYSASIDPPRTYGIRARVHF